nr:hypothetical protein [Nocardia yunnanensis]
MHTASGSDIRRDGVEVRAQVLGHAQVGTRIGVHDALVVVDERQAQSAAVLVELAHPPVIYAEFAHLGPKRHPRRFDPTESTDVAKMEAQPHLRQRVDRQPGRAAEGEVQRRCADIANLEDRLSVGGPFAVPFEPCRGLGDLLGGPLG